MLHAILICCLFVIVHLVNITKQMILCLTYTQKGICVKQNILRSSRYRAGRIGPATPVLAGPVFSQGKNKVPFLQKVSNKQSASVILGLIRLIILSYNR